MTGTVDARYTLRQIEELLGLPRRVVAGLVEAGFVTPQRGPRNAYRFTFQDVVLLRTAHRLRTAQVPTKRLVQSLKALREQLPAEVPITGLRIKAAGTQVAVRRGGAPWEPLTGQLLLDFEVAAGENTVAFIDHPRPTAGEVPRAPTSAALAERFDRAERLEPQDAAAAEALYREVLADEPGHADAAVNLAALLCDAGRAAEARAACLQGLAAHPDVALLHYNLAIALEDLREPAQALEAYAACLRLDPSQADAHYNAARLNERLGRRQAALRHYNAYRRLVQR
ncbi:MAG: tetratricopeptide repeat protein [Rubrivivax sp.]|nr:tetratricopeptide repeat protein [Rubrivivax sp.]